MGKRGKWFSAVKKAFSPSKDTEKSPSKSKSPSKIGEKEESESAEQKKPPGGKKRWSFGRSSHNEPAHREVVRRQETTVDSENIPQLPSLPEKTLAEVEQEQSKHAMAVAVATAAAAEAAVAAAQAADGVVRLTGAGRASFYGGQNMEEWAAIKIQTAFRGYLARRALRALKGLVRLQALVRGHAVRRQTTTTLRCMQALVRLQAQVHSRRCRFSEESQGLQRQLWQRQQQEAIPKLEADCGNQEEWDDNVQPAEVIQAKMQSKHEAAMKRERALAYAFSHQPWRGMEKPDSSMLIESESGKHDWGWSWLERWMAARPWESRVVGKDGTDTLPARSMEEALLPLDIGRQSTNSRTNGLQPGTVNSYSNPVVAGQKIARQVAPQSPMTPQTFKPSISNVRSVSPRSIRALDEEGSAFSVAGGTPSFVSAPPRFSSRHSVASSSLHDDESLVSLSTVPSYMAATESARAKFRSHSTPKQRPGTPEKEASLSARKRVSFPVAEAVIGNSGLAKQNRPTVPERNPSLKVHSGPMNSDVQMIPPLSGNFRMHYK